LPITIFHIRRSTSGEGGGHPVSPGWDFSEKRRCVVRSRIGRTERIRKTNTLLGVALVAGAVLLAAGVAGAAPAARTLATFNTPGTYTWTVPSRVFSVTLDVWGAYGGNSEDHSSIPGAIVLIAPGGAGGEAKATVAVKPGETFEIVVGARGGAGIDTAPGAGGFNGGADGFEGGIACCPSANYFGGGGGGGASDVRIGGKGNDCASMMICDDTNRVLVGGGGGGGGGDPATISFGGKGGGVEGTGGGASSTGGGGEPGTQYTGGNCVDELCRGSFGVGGDGRLTAAGGGGGGWFGGGGGFPNPAVPPGNPEGHDGGGGGGGSGFISALALVSSFPGGTSPSAMGDGYVVITSP
jgi:Glycine rich protein